MYVHPKHTCDDNTIDFWLFLIYKGKHFLSEYLFLLYGSEYSSQLGSMTQELRSNLRDFLCRISIVSLSSSLQLTQVPGEIQGDLASDRIVIQKWR